MPFPENTSSVRKEKYTISQKKHLEVQVSENLAPENLTSKCKLEKIGNIELSVREILPVTRRLFEEKVSLSREFEISQFLEKEKNVIIYGGAGSGKTYTLKWLNSRFTGKYLEKKKDFFPLYLSLDSYINGSFYSYVKVKAEQKGVHESEFNSLLEGKVLFLLDGLDQLPQARDFSPGFSPLEEILDFISEYEDCRYVITSRPGFYYSINCSFAVCEMEQLTDKKIMSFIELHVPDKKNAEFLKTRVFNGEIQKPLLRTPFTLLLWLKTVMFSLNPMKNEKYARGLESAFFRTGEVYQAFISELFRRHEAENGNTLNFRRIENVLKDLAFRLQYRNKVSCDYCYALEIAEKYSKNTSGRGYTDEDASHIYASSIYYSMDCRTEGCKGESYEDEGDRTESYKGESYGGEAKKVLHACLELGLLTRNGCEIKFGIHRAFQEYFAALKLKADLEKGIDISELFERPEWRNALILCSEMLEQGIAENGDEISGRGIADKLVNSIIQIGDLDLASSCTEKAGLEMQNKLCSLLAEKLDSRYTVEKIRVVRNLGGMGARGIELILEAFHDEDVSVRMEAARVLGKTESEDAVSPLMCALGDCDYPVRREAVKALGKIGSGRAIELLTWAFQDELRVIRLEATEALAQIGSESALKVLISALGSSDDFVRIGATGALGRLNSEKTEGALIKAFLEGDHLVRWGAAEALGQMRSEKAVGMFVEFLESEDEFLRWTTAKALGKMRSEQAFGLFVKALGDENRFVRREAAKALGMLWEGKKDTVPASLISVLTLTLTDEDEFVRKAAAETLGEIGVINAVNPLIDLLGDQSHSVRVETVKALGKIESEKAVSSLLFALGDENHFVRREAGKALRKMELEKTLEPLINAFLSQEEVIRQEVVRTLGFIISGKGLKGEEGVNEGTDEGTDERLKRSKDQIFATLVNALEDRDRLVRREAAKALGNLFGQESEIVFKSLLKALEDKDPEVRRLASRALANLDSERAAEPLLFALRSEDEVVRRLAAEALGRLKSEKAIRSLIEVTLSDNDGFARREAARALGHIKSKKAIKPLIEALTDKNNTGKWGAAEALGRLKAKNAINPLINALSDSDDFTRWAAAKALGRIKSQKAIVPLLSTLHDRNRFVKAEAASSLAEICTKENNHLLEVLLNSKNQFEANLAFEALEEIKLRENSR